jgi:ubiquinone/menaquinone biosynthesis C-methylase UbiE
MEARENQYLYRPEFGNEADIARLINQYSATIPVVKLFHPVFEPQGTETMLDLGCGPGSWVLDIAFRYPDTSLIGLDIDESAVRYAMARATSSGYENATFEVHDATTTLPISDASVDYVHLSLANSFLLKDQWPLLLAECYRVLRPGGWLRSIEWLSNPSNSLALQRSTRLFHQALTREGKRYVELAPCLRSLLKQAGFAPTALTIHSVDYSEGEPAHKALAEDIYVSSYLARPFEIAYGLATQEEVEEISEGIQRDMMLPNFCGLLLLSDIAAQKPA